MRLKCPHCKTKYKFLNLYLFRLKGYKIKCENCGSVFELRGNIDQFGILLIALLAMGLFVLLGMLIKTLSNYFTFSGSLEIIIIVLIIVLISLLIICGHPAYLVWNISRKYKKECEFKNKNHK